MRQEVKEGFLEAAGVARETGLIPPLSLKPSRKCGLCFLSLAKSGDHWKLPEGRLLALLASEQRLLPLLPHPCARSLALPTRMGSPARLLSAELRFAFAEKSVNQGIQEIVEQKNSACLSVSFSSPSPPRFCPSLFLYHKSSLFPLIKVQSSQVCQGTTAQHDK